MLLALSRVHQAGKDVFALQLLEIKKDFLERYPRRQPAQQIAYRDAGVAHAMFAETNFGVDADAGSHGVQARIVSLRDSLRLEFGRGWERCVGCGLKQVGVNFSRKFGSNLLTKRLLHKG